jgi:adenosylhomocysteinase
MYNVAEKIKLSVCGMYLRDRSIQKYIKDTRFIIIEHILPTTEAFIRHLKEDGKSEVFSLFAKPYSIDEDVLERLVKDGVNVIEESYSKLESEGYLEKHLLQAIEKSKKDGKRIVIVEVGGYFAQPLLRLCNQISSHDLKYIAGVVEDTTFGHNRYKRVAADLQVPVFSVARSQLKEIEARFVGRDAVAAVDKVFRQLGVSMTGGKALVLGYGMIGKNVARTLKAYDLIVSVYDKDHDHKNLRAFIDGFRVNKREELLKSTDVIFAATGEQSLEYDRISDCALSNDGVVLASVGSKDTEFDVKRVKELAEERIEIGENIVKYKLPNKRHVVVVKDGTAVNFLLPSIPIEVLDLIFSEILLAVFALLKESVPSGEVHVIAENTLSVIARDWLRVIAL